VRTPVVLLAAGGVAAMLVSAVVVGTAPGPVTGRPVGAAQQDVDPGPARPPGADPSGGPTPASSAPPATTTAAPPAPVAGTSLGGCPNLPAQDVWHADVSRLPVHANSAAYVASIGRDRAAKADFGAGEWDGGPVGIPITYVPASQPRVQVSFDWPDESDRGPYPIPKNVAIEGGPDSGGDRHILVVDTGACRLYELYDAYPRSDGSWHAGCGAMFDLRDYRLRPRGWTSADAAGLPIAPGLVRFEEVAAGRIDHAIRVTAPVTQNRFVWPARHAASDHGDTALPPMGLRLRLKAGVDLSRLPAQARVVARAMQTYGVIVADNGSPWFLSGTPDARWSDAALRTLGSLRGSDFEAVDTSALMSSPDTGRVR
jgi:hypothetical protein